MDKVLFAAKYVEGDLNEIEYREFENAIQYDSELQEYLSYYRQVHAKVAVQLKETFSLPKIRKAKSSSEAETSYTAEELTYGLDYLWYGIVVIGLLIGLFIWSPWKTTLYDEFKIDKTQIVSSLSAAPYKDFDKAAMLFDAGDYYAAKLLISNSYIKNPEDPTLASYYAMVLLADGAVETINEVLSPVWANGKLQPDRDVAYLLALSYLQKEDYSTCKEWLRKVPESSGHYLQAAQLLSQI